MNEKKKIFCIVKDFIKVEQTEIFLHKLYLGTIVFSGFKVMPYFFVKIKINLKICLQSRNGFV